MICNLKPCPFCGENVRISRYIDEISENHFRVVCTNCDVKIDGYIRTKSEEEITDWWNRRVNE